MRLVLFNFTHQFMADNSTPAATETPTAPAASTPAAPSGTGTGAKPDSAAPAKTGDKPNDATYEQRWKDATAHNTRIEQQNARYRELYGDLDDKPATPAASKPQEPSNQDVVTRAEFDDFTLTQQLSKVPSILPHKEEVGKLLKTKTVEYKEAVEIVAKRHNITLGPIPGPLDSMPNDTGGGARPAAQADFTDAQKSALQAEGKDPEKLKKHLPALEKAWGKARRK